VWISFYRLFWRWTKPTSVWLVGSRCSQ
jgi:hypothetical protein